MKEGVEALFEDVASASTNHPATIEGRYDDITGLQDDIDGELNEIFGEFGGDPDDTQYEVRVYRTQPGRGKLAYLFACLPHELPIMDKLRDLYDGGDFEIRVLRDKKLFRRLKVCIETPKIPKIPTVNGDNDIARVMADGFSRLGELIVKAQATNTQQDQFASQRQMLENMMLMKDFMGLNAALPAPPDPLDQLAKLLEIQKMISPEKPEKSGAMDVMMSMAETLLPRLATVGDNEATRINERESVPKQENTGKGNKMKMQIMYLCAQAKNGKNPVEFADRIISSIPEENLPGFVDFISGPHALENLIKIHTDVVNYGDWFKKLGDEVVRIYEEEFVDIDDSDLTDSDNGSINPGNTDIEGKPNGAPETSPDSK